MPAIDGVLADDAVPSPRTWVILGQRAGDNAQVRALARALGYTVPYAVGAILLTIWGLVIVLLTQ